MRAIRDGQNGPEETDASAAVLNVTSTGSTGPGFFTVFPCGESIPTASSLNYSTGQNIANAVVAKIGADGKVCVFTNNGSHLVVDVNGYYPKGSSFSPLSPARLVDTRSGLPTIDGQGAGGGLLAPGSVGEVIVAGRGGVPTDASAAVLNVTSTGSTGPGFFTVFPCGESIPTASSLNYSTGQNIANAVVAKIGADGKVCVFTNNGSHLVVDVNGYYPNGSDFGALTPFRLLDTRE